MKKLTVVLVMFLFLIVITVTLLTRRNNQSSKFIPNNSTITPSLKPSGNPLYAAGKTTIVIYVKNWEFNPSTIKAKQGDDVILKVKSVDVSHGISLPAFNINQQLPAFTMETIEFKADKKGSFTYTCTVHCGPKASSMKGTLIVE